jgi:hypothetical protein
MSNLIITNNDLGSVVYGPAEFRDETLAFGAADVAAEGTILARKEVVTAITVAADAGNTGDGTCTLASVVAGPAIPLVGDYTLECVEAITNGGRFKLEDPNGALISNNLIMTAGAGAATVFELAGMTFTLTDGATDFVVGDKFALTVDADGKLGYYATAGLGGLQVPTHVLTYAITVTGAENKAIRAMVAGKVRKERLILDADGDGSNITNSILDKLRDIGIVPIDVTEVNVLDNQ